MKNMILFFLAFSLAFLPFTTMAISGKNAKNVYVEINTKQGNKWFTARNVKTDKDSSLKLKDVLPGKYKFELDKKDRKSGQTLALKLKMLDKNGKKIKGKAKIDAYIYVGDIKIFINTFKTNKNGYLNLEGIIPNTVYELKVKDNGKISKKNNLARIKTKTKINKSKWFTSSYKRLDSDTTGLTNGILKMTNVLPGKYKFKIKSGDNYDMRKPFIVKARMRKNNGKKIKKPTTVKVYAYPYGIRLKIAEIQTDNKGWITLPKAQPGMKYRLKIKK